MPKYEATVLTMAGDKVHRVFEVANLNEVAAIHGRYPQHPVGLFEAVPGGEMWMYWPDLAAADAWEEQKAKRLARKAGR